MAATAALSLGALAPAASADPTLLYHLEYGMGGALGSNPGFRPNLDVATAVGFMHPLRMKSDDGKTQFEANLGESGWLVGGALVTGFGAYPTYAMVEAGQTIVSIVGGSMTLGPAVRLDPKIGMGLEGSMSLRFFIFQLGVRVIGVFVNDADVQICGVMGLGNY